MLRVPLLRVRAQRGVECLDTLNQRTLRAPARPRLYFADDFAEHRLRERPPLAGLVSREGVPLVHEQFDDLPSVQLGRRLGILGFDGRRTERLCAVLGVNRDAVLTRPNRSDRLAGGLDGGSRRGFRRQARVNRRELLGRCRVAKLNE